MTRYRKYQGVPHFGRRLFDDPRDRQFSAAPLLTPERPLPVRMRYAVAPIRLDQGVHAPSRWCNGIDHPHCVGYAWRAWMTSAPIQTYKADTGVTIWHRAQELDEWPGTDPSEGTTLRAGAKVMQAQGRIAEYRWCYSVDELCTWMLSGKGPVLFGGNWYSGMMQPALNGTVHLTGSPLGGHAWLIYGVDMQQEIVRCVNSWGQTWGYNGTFVLALDALGTLLQEDGEACGAVERKVKRMPVDE